MPDILDTLSFEKYRDNDDEFNTVTLKNNALKAIIPKIIENELTEKQSLCFRLFYVHNNSQQEIARKLGLSQPTVSRHISAAKKITTAFLTYCSLTATHVTKDMENHFLM